MSGPKSFGYGSFRLGKGLIGCDRHDHPGRRYRAVRVARNSRGTCGRSCQPAPNVAVSRRCEIQPDNTLIRKGDFPYQ
jgi:hypothetical protein